MADYIYLLENRLSPGQRTALRTVRELARSRNLTIFLVGGAVRDLTSGSPVRDLDVVVQGNALKLKKELEKLGATITGELDAAQALFASFPGSVRMEIGSTLSAIYPKPNKPVLKPASILDDLRRRDFTANAMALSLNEGSYGLLMDPLNGVADIENRELRLVSNYGFIEDPIRMVRAARLMARLGWALDEKTQARYNTGKEENYIASMTDLQRGYETEEIVHEEDPLRVLKRLEAEGWMKALAPFWTAAKVDVNGLERLRETQTQLQMQGLYPDGSAANFPLLTAKLAPKEVAKLKSGFIRQGFVKEIDSLEAKAKELAALLTSKNAALASQSWKILTSAPPEAVLSVAYSTKSPVLQAKFKNFSSVWPQARQKMPYLMMQEMRILPDLPGYEDLLGKLFFELMDEKLQTPEEMKAFLEPFSPPAPPPPVSLRRPRAPKKDARAAKSRAKKAAASESVGEDATSDLNEVVIEVLKELGDEQQVGVPDLSTGRPEAEAKRASVVKPAKTAAKVPAPSSAKSPARVPAGPGSIATAPAKVATKTTAKGPAKTPVKAAPVKSPASKASVPAKKAAAVVSRRSGAPVKAVKSTAAKTTVKKGVSSAKKTAPKKAVKAVAPAKKGAAAKTVPGKKTSAKKIAAKKAVAAKPATRKTAPVKAAAKKSVPAKKRK